MSVTHALDLSSSNSVVAGVEYEGTKRDSYNFNGALKAKNILVVEDDVKLRFAMSIYLKSWGHKVLEAGNALKAIQLVEEHFPDVILLDVVLPDINGFEVADTVHNLYGSSQTSIIFSTGNTIPGVWDEAFQHGAQAFLEKPFSKEELFEVIRGIEE